MPAPTTILITGTWIRPDGTHPTGFVTFTPVDPRTINNTNVIDNAPVVATLDTNGQIAQPLVQNSDGYIVVEVIARQPIAQYQIFAAQNLNLGGSTANPNNLVGIAGVLASVSTRAAFHRTLPDTVGITNSRTSALAHHNTLVNAVGVTSTRTLHRTMARTISNTVGVTDSVSGGNVSSPRNLAVTLGAGQAFINLQTPTSGVPDSYAVVATLVGGAALPTLTITPTGGTWEKGVISGLTVGANYTVAVTATKGATTGPAASSISQQCVPAGLAFSPLLNRMPSGDICAGVWLGARVRDWAGNDHTIPTSLTTGAIGPNYTTDTTVVGQIITGPITRNTGVHVTYIGCKVIATNDSSYANNGIVRVTNGDTTGHFTSNFTEYDGSTGYTDGSTYSKDTYGNVTGGVFAAIDGANFTSQSDHVHHTSHGHNVHFNANATIQACAIWKMVDSTTTQTQHVDGIYTGGGSTILYQWNHVQNDWNQTGAIVCGAFDGGATTLADITVDANIIDGGGWQYIGHSGNTVRPKNVTFTNNVYPRSLQVSGAVTIAASMGAVTMARAPVASTEISGNGLFLCDDGTVVPFAFNGIIGAALQNVTTTSGTGKTCTASGSTAGPQQQGTVRLIGPGNVGLIGQWPRSAWNNGPINVAQTPVQSDGVTDWASAAHTGNIFDDGTAVSGL